MRARLTILQAAGASRLVTMRAPRFSALPRAVPRRSATSGVRSTLIRPCTPSRPKMREPPRDSQIRLEWICAPHSTSLYG